MTRSKAFQVQLEPEQHRQLQRLAKRRGRSMGSLVRESVASYLTDLAADDEPLAELIGIFEDSGPAPHGDVAEAHDAYIADGGTAEAAAKAAAEPAP